MASFLIFTIFFNEKAGGKLRQGQGLTKEVTQEYIAGSDSVTDDSATRDFVVTRARIAAARSVHFFCKQI